MKLYIDTSSNKKTVVKLGDVVLEKDSSIWHSQVVLLMIDELLKSQNKTLKDITEVEIEKSGESFTGLRVGAAIANALSFSLNLSSKEIIYPQY